MCVFYDLVGHIGHSDVIISILPVFSDLARVVIYAGPPTHLLHIVSYLVQVDDGFGIALPTRDVFFANMVFKGSFVQVGDAVLEANLIPLDIVDLDIFLRMHWLEKHHVSVDCF